MRQADGLKGRRRAASAGGACCALALLCVAVLGAIATPVAPDRRGAPAPSNRVVRAARTHYRIDLKLDFDGRRYTGTERVRWVNEDDRPCSVLYFHLYPNLRVNESVPTPSGTEPLAPDEPRLEVTEVRAAPAAQPLAFSLDDQAMTLRVQLREAVAPGAPTEIEIQFIGRVPEIDPDETSLPAHVVQQVGAAIRDSREWRRARDTNFSSRGVMLLGTAYPVLAVRDGDDWQRKVEASVGDTVYTEVADYEVAIEAPPDVALFTSGEPRDRAERPGGRARVFAGENLRNFAILAGRPLRSAEREVSGVRVRSIYTAEHEKVGRRVLGVASEAVRVYVARFGGLPFKAVSIAEAPLVAGLGSAEFAGLGVIASAFYVDFDAPATRNLPELVREQRASVEDSLEFTAAHVVAQQWWGVTVGNDPEREPVIDEALAHWSALVYYGEAHGPERAAQAMDDQLRGVYQVYRSFGGEDMAADRAAREYRNSFQYAAIVSSKGALLFAALHRLMGDEHFWVALRRYYEANRLEIAEMEDLRAFFVAEAPVAQRRAVTRAFNRWLSEKRGDEDIAPPNPQLAAALGLANEPNGSKDRNAFSRLGRFFWRQMTRIR